MTDPLDALRAPIVPVDPDRGFAGSLRARLVRALLDIPEEPMTATLTLPAGVRPRSLIPRLTVLDARAAVDFCVAAFGAARHGEVTLLPDGWVANVEIVIGGCVLMLTEEYPEGNLVAPLTRGGTSQSLRLEVDDPDAAIDRALAAGAALDSPVADAPYGRSGAVLDPSGHRWVLSRSASDPARVGDIVHALLLRPDVERAARFYTDVLGWTVGAGHGDHSRLVEGRSPGLGMLTRQAPATTQLSFSVADVDAAVALVRAAGGTATDPTDRPFGRSALCVDDQGIPFALSSMRGAPAAARAGDLDYVEFRVPDAGRARAFYGTVLGWRFVPGNDPGYWHPATADGDLTRPMSGLVGGHAEATVVPTFRVADIDAAAVAVRAAGGATAGVETGRHGLGAECTDDQGAPFLLAQPT